MYKGPDECSEGKTEHNFQIYFDCSYCERNEVINITLGCFANDVYCNDFSTLKNDGVIGCEGCGSQVYNVFFPCRPGKSNCERENDIEVEVLNVDEN